MYYFVAATHQSLSKVGVQAQNDPESANKATVTLAIDGLPDNEIQHLVLHEFGHILGLCHEHQHSDYLSVMDRFLVSDSELKKTAEIKSLREFKQQYKELNFTAEESGYDKYSIMHYP